MNTTLQEVSEAVKTIPGIITDIEKLKEQKPVVNNHYYSVVMADKTGTVDATKAIIEANNASVSGKTYAVLFPSGDYRITPNQIRIPDGVRWMGSGKAKIFTQENTLYNVMLTAGSNVQISGLHFSQAKDSAMDMNSQAFKGLHMIHAPDVNNLEIRDCEFDSSGVTAILVQNQNMDTGYNINILNNRFKFTRKIDREFDVSVICVDSFSGAIKDNLLLSQKTGDISCWKAETAIEVHSPNMLVENNTVHGFINGILPTAWGGLYETYDDTFRGRLMICKNTLLRCVRGISYWGAPLATIGTTARNVFILDNYINLALEKRPMSGYYYPTEGIGLEDHNSSNVPCFFRDIRISGNRIETTYETGLSAISLLNFAPMGARQTGAVNLQTKYRCEDIDILDNDIDFPFPSFNLKADAPVMHRNIRVFGNRLTNPAVFYVYASGGFDAVYNLENIEKAYLSGNLIRGIPIAIKKEGKNVSNIIY